LSKRDSYPDLLDRQLDVRATALVTPGAITGRVRVIGPRGGVSQGRKPPRTLQRSVKRRREVSQPRKSSKLRDAEPTVQVCISMLQSEQDDLDAAALLKQLPRSEVVRRALRGFYGKDLAPGWREIAKRRR
jgi:hypothetical protein